MKNLKNKAKAKIKDLNLFIKALPKAASYAINH